MIGSAGRANSHTNRYRETTHLGSRGGLHPRLSAGWCTIVSRFSCLFAGFFLFWVAGSLFSGILFARQRDDKGKGVFVSRDKKIHTFGCYTTSHGIFECTDFTLSILTWIALVGLEPKLSYRSKFPGGK